MASTGISGEVCGYYFPVTFFCNLLKVIGYFNGYCIACSLLAGATVNISFFLLAHMLVHMYDCR